MKNILISVCLANDMVRPIKKHEAPPHRLHIGYYEAVRLLGHEWKEGPLIRFLQSCHNTPPEKLCIIHTRDWHSADDPLQRPELQKYGFHCMENSEGAAFVWEKGDVVSYATNKPYLFNSRKIMTAAEPAFAAVLRKAIGNTPPDDVKIGIIGVLTNIKVAQMAIALQGYYNLPNIAVCSALTASNNIRKHFEGLEDLSNVYGIQVFDSISLFSEWLKMRSPQRSNIHSFSTPSIQSKSVLSRGQRYVAEYLYRECSSVVMDELRGGFSGSLVLLARGKDSAGFVQVPSIIKIDKRESIGKERAGFEKIQHVLGAHAPTILDSIESEEGAGIRYAFAAMNKKDKPATFRDVYMNLDFARQDDRVRLKNMFNVLFEEIIVPLTSNWTLNQRQLWTANTFKKEYTGSILKNVQKITGSPPTTNKNTITIPGAGAFYNPALFYTEEHIDAKNSEPVSYVRQSLAHGDLNARNIIIDDHLNMWLIDFFHTTYDQHSIQDIVKLENDLKFIHTRLKTTEDLKKAIVLEKIFLAQRKLSDKLQEMPKEVARNKELAKLYASVCILRSYAYAVSRDKDMRHYFIPQLRYAAHNLGFDESTMMQKRYALASTAMLCEHLQKT